MQIWKEIFAFYKTAFGSSLSAWRIYTLELQIFLFNILGAMHSPTRTTHCSYLDCSQGCINEFPVSKEQSSVIFFSFFLFFIIIYSLTWLGITIVLGSREVLLEQDFVPSSRSPWTPGKGTLWKQSPSTNQGSNNHRSCRWQHRWPWSFII